MTTPLRFSLLTGLAALLLAACQLTVMPAPGATPSPQASLPSTGDAYPIKPADSNGGYPPPGLPTQTPGGPVAIIDNTTTPRPVLPPSITPIPFVIPAVPNPDLLQWETIPGVGGTLKQLFGLPGSIFSAAPSQDGNWWAIANTDPPIHSYQIFALTVLDAQANEHWGAGQMLYPSSFDWTPEGQLAWISAGDLSFANADGGGRTDLFVPESLYEIWPLSGRRFFAAGQTAFWQVNLATNAWHPVENILHPFANEMGGNVPPISEYWKTVISPDQSFMTTTYEGRIYKIPLNSESPPEWIATLDKVISASPLADSPFWSIGSCGPGFGDALLDSRDGSVVPIASLLPPGIEQLASALPEKAHALLRPAAGGGAGCQRPYYFLSPDAHWFYTIIGSIETPQIYLAPTSSLAAGRIIPHQFYFPGWQSDPAAVLYQELDGTLARLPLPAGEPISLILLEYPTYANFTIETTNDRVFIAGLTDKGNLYLYAFANNGTLLSTLETPILINTPNNLGESDRVYLWASSANTLLIQINLAHGAALFLWSP